jgi:hypothetical protein
MNPLAMVQSLIFLLSAALPLGQQSIGKRPSLCQPDSLPSSIQHRLREEYGSWRVQGVANLSQRAHSRWESEKPLECPGIAAEGRGNSDGTVQHGDSMTPKIENGEATSLD